MSVLRLFGVGVVGFGVDVVGGVGGILLIRLRVVVVGVYIVLLLLLLLVTDAKFRFIGITNQLWKPSGARAMSLFVPLSIFLPLFSLLQKPDSANKVFLHLFEESDW